MKISKKIILILINVIWLNANAQDLQKNTSYEELLKIGQYDTSLKVISTLKIVNSRDFIEENPQQLPSLLSADYENPSQIVKLEIDPDLYSLQLQVVDKEPNNVGYLFDVLINDIQFKLPEFGKARKENESILDKLKQKYQIPNDQIPSGKNIASLGSLYGHEVSILYPFDGSNFGSAKFPIELSFQVQPSQEQWIGKIPSDLSSFNYNYTFIQKSILPEYREKIPKNKTIDQPMGRVKLRFNFSGSHGLNVAAVKDNNNPVGKEFRSMIYRFVKMYKRIANIIVTFDESSFVDIADSVKDKEQKKLINDYAKDFQIHSWDKIGEHLQALIDYNRTIIKQDLNNHQDIINMYFIESTTDIGADFSAHISGGLPGVFRSDDSRYAGIIISTGGGMTGLPLELIATVLGHELSHYLGLDHADSPANLITDSKNDDVFNLMHTLVLRQRMLGEALSPQVKLTDGQRRVISGHPYVELVY